MGPPTGKPDRTPAASENQPESRQNTASATAGTEAGARQDSSPPESAGASAARSLLLPVGLSLAAVILSVAIGVLLVLKRAPADDPEVPAAGSPGEPTASATLVLDWPAAERRDAFLLIDGRVHPLEGTSRGPRGRQLEIPLAAGLHEVWIGRQGFLPYAAKVETDAAATRTLTPTWVEREGIKADLARDSVGDDPPMRSTDPPRPPDLAGLPELPQLPELAPGVGEALEPVSSPAADSPVGPPAAPPEEEPAASDSPPSAWLELAEEAAQCERLEAAVQEQLANWDFAGAARRLRQLSGATPREAEFLEQRAEAIEQLADLKARLVEWINAAAPPLRKSDLMLRGPGGDVQSAGEQGITAVVAGEQELHRWSDLGEKARSQLLEVCQRQSARQGLVEVALLAEQFGEGDKAEELLVAARERGVNTSRSPTAATIVAARVRSAIELLQAEQYGQAAAALRSLADKFQDNAWFVRRRAAVDSAIAQAETGLQRKAAEELYQRAVQHFKDGELRSLAEDLRQLRAAAPDAGLFDDESRDPSFGELEAAVAELGGHLIVCSDGTGDHTTIQAAIDAAEANTLIEIADAGPYNESLQIPASKTGLMIRGGEGVWPLITSAGPVRGFPTLVSVAAPATTIERLVLVHAAAEGNPIRGISVSGRLRIRGCFVQMLTPAKDPGVHVGNRGDCEIVDSILYTHVAAAGGRLEVRNSVLLGDTSVPSSGGEFLHVTSTAVVSLSGNSSTLRKSILNAVGSNRPGNRIEFCNVLMYLDKAEPGEGCVSHAIRFRSPAAFDFRLHGDHRRPASADGDWGCQYSEEMVDMIRAVGSHGLRLNVVR